MTGLCWVSTGNLLCLSEGVRFGCSRFILLAGRCFSSVNFEFLARVLAEACRAFRGFGSLRTRDPENIYQ